MSYLIDYMNARYYGSARLPNRDPQLGQFISPDTLVPDATQLMDFNRYAYARGNPMKYNDPSGHCGTAVVSGGSTAALDLTCWEIMGAAAGEVAAPAAAAAATVAVVGGTYLAAQWAIQDNGPTVPPLYPTLGHNVGDGNISITIPVPNSTTVTSGVPLNSDNQTAIAGVTPVNSPAQQIVEPLPQQRTASELIVQVSPNQIANGHAYNKHVVQQKEFPEVKNHAEFEQLIADVMNNPDEQKALSSGRQAYWKGNTVVITNPKATDGGTAFRR